MSLSSLLLGVWLILVGIAWLGWVVINIKFLGLWAFITGILIIVEGYHPLIIWKRP
jgi:hypothetical protein